MKNVLKQTIAAYKVVVDENYTFDDIDVSGIKCGFVCDKTVSRSLLIDLCKAYSSIKLDKSDTQRVLITKEEYENKDLIELLIKQVIHYISGGNYGKNEVEFENETLTFDLLRVVNLKQLEKLVYNDIYSNKPLSNEKLICIKKIINFYGIKIDHKLVINNESKMFFEIINDGDDCVRYLIYSVTGNTMLIKSSSNISIIKSNFPNEILTNEKFIEIATEHKHELAEVFNRHKKIILAFKNEETKTIINKISKMSKKEHKPIEQPINKTFIAKAYRGEIGYYNISATLRNISVTDKLKYLYALDVKLAGLDKDFYMIRNGKCYYKDKTRYHNKRDILRLKDDVLNSLKHDLSYLKGKTIKYPKNIDYGLPISEKQTVSQIPFGTIVKSEELLSVGVYWENGNGYSSDVDLSLIKSDGNRYGWGNRSGYDNPDFMFSGDITNAPNGAMEFFVQKKRSDDSWIYISNLFSGKTKDNKYKIVIGTDKDVDKKYINSVYLELETEFVKKGELIGALRNNEFILWKAAMSRDNISSDKNKAFVPYILVERFTLSDLLNSVGAKLIYDQDIKCDYDLSIELITFDKLQNILLNK